MGNSHTCPPLRKQMFIDYAEYIHTLAQHGHEAHGSPLLHHCTRGAPIPADTVWRFWCGMSVLHADAEKRYACLDVQRRLRSASFSSKSLEAQAGGPAARFSADHP